MEITGNILILTGSVFLFLGSLGILRMPDIYNRLQAGTKATTLGAMSVILGAGFLVPGMMAKSIALVLFIVLTNPVSSSTIARAGYKSGVPMADETVADAYADSFSTEEV